MLGMEVLEQDNANLRARLCTMENRVAYLEAALTEARAQGAAEERERLAKDADNRADVNSHLPPEMTHDWDHFAEWLRSNTGEG